MEESGKGGASERTLRAQDEFQLGLAFFQKRQWKTAARHFRLADERSPRHDSQASVYQSYYGLSLVYSGDVSGLNLCRNASARARHKPDVFLNLALAELKFSHRKRACAALTQGLRIDAQHAGLLKLRKRIGMRRKPCIPFLKRDNPLNKWLGKATYRHGGGGASE